MVPITINITHFFKETLFAANIEQFQRKPTEDRAQGQSQSPGKASVRRHGSGRRHTLQNGVDHNMVNTFCVHILMCMGWKVEGREKSLCVVNVLFKFGVKFKK